MPTVKTPEERGPLAAWAYESRDALGLSPEQVVLLLPLKNGRPYNAATLRKAEASSEDMSGPLWRELVKLYSRLAREQRVVLAPVPLTATTQPSSTGDTAALMARLDRQAEVIDAQAQAITELARSVQAALGALGIEHGNLMHALGIRLGQSGTPLDPVPDTDAETPPVLGRDGPAR